MFEAHFQTFEEPEAGVALSARLAALREELIRRKLTGFVIPRADQQQNEYVPPSDERLAWPWCCRRRRPSSSTGATRSRRRSRSIPTPGRSNRWSIRRRKTGSLPI